MMTKIIADDEFNRLTYYPEYNFIKSEWKKFAPDAQFKMVYERIREMTAKYKVNKILFDSRNFKGTSPAMQQWVRDSFIDMMLNIGMQAFGVVLSQDIFAKITIRSFLSEIHETSLKYKLCTSYEEAIDWISTVDEALN
jgi:hypothetical protein